MKYLPYKRTLYYPFDFLFIQTNKWCLFMQKSTPQSERWSPGFTRDSWLSVNINVVPNTSVMFAHLGGTPKLWLKGSVSTWNSTNTLNETGQFQMLLGNNKLLYLMSRRQKVVDMQTKPQTSKYHLHKNIKCAAGIATIYCCELAYITASLSKTDIVFLHLFHFHLFQA